MNPRVIRFGDGTTIRADCIAAIRPRLTGTSNQPFPTSDYGLSVEYAVGQKQCEYRVMGLTEAQRTQYLDTIITAWSASPVPKSDRLDAFVRDVTANTAALNEGV